MTTAKIILRSFIGDAGGSVSGDTTTTYDDKETSSKITMSFSPDGGQAVNTIINTTHPDYSKLMLMCQAFHV